MTRLEHAPSPVRLAIVADFTPQAQRRQMSLPCTIGIYLQTAEGTYSAYGISGGP